MKAIFLGFSRAKLMIGPTWSLFTPLMSVVTRMISMPASCMFSMARSFTSNRLPTWRWLLASLPTPSNCRYA